MEEDSSRSGRKRYTAKNIMVKDSYWEHRRMCQRLMQTSHTLPSLAHQDVCMFPGSMYLVRGWEWGMGMSTTLCLKRPPQISAGVLLLPQPQMCYLSLICYAGEMPIHWTGHLKTSWADSRIDWTRHGGFTSIMSILRRLRQKYHGFKASLNYIARPCQKQKCWGKPPNVLYKLI